MFKGLENPGQLPKWNLHNACHAVKILVKKIIKSKSSKCLHLWRWNHGMFLREKWQNYDKYWIIINNWLISLVIYLRRSAESDPAAASFAPLTVYRTVCSHLAFTLLKWISSYRCCPLSWAWAALEHWNSLLYYDNDSVYLTPLITLIINRLVWML